MTFLTLSASLEIIALILLAFTNAPLPIFINLGICVLLSSKIFYIAYPASRVNEARYIYKDFRPQEFLQIPVCA
jgi:hypothetical protein